jgi:hypothetical protein
MSWCHFLHPEGSIGQPLSTPAITPPTPAITPRAPTKTMATDVEDDIDAAAMRMALELSVQSYQEERSSSSELPSCPSALCTDHDDSDLVCPITLERMTDPVMTQSGSTYERAAIEAWFASGRTDDPETGEQLHDCRLIGNKLVRRLLHR